MSLSNTPRIRSSLSKEADITSTDQDKETKLEIGSENLLERSISGNQQQQQPQAQQLQNNKEPDKKRKDNINQKIAELLELIPPTFFSDISEKNSGTKDGKPNKGQILSKSVDYITYLQNEIDSRNRKEVELTMLLQHSPHNKHTVAEEMLAKIGVGPLAEE